ncbi:MAG: ATP-binding protein [Tannerella sp.]|jgi:hypothetical protein|nr:ATP-binding protein [Tannerella sp.]
MMNQQRKLPIGIQSFEDLRVNNYLYVDKTSYVYRLANYGKPYFLGRPRRFGKSLFLSTLKAYFFGKKELFEGLAIAEQEKDWLEYPVFHLDMNVGIITDGVSLYQRLGVILTDLENQWGRTVDGNDPATRFEAVIKQACKQTGRRVVVLVDEYDKPLLATMNDLDANDAIRDVLKAFYGVLKSADEYLRFIFFTGVTKFSKVSIFSDLNQLDDISMDKRYGGICGISESELLRDFWPELQALSEETGKTGEDVFAEMKKRYDGYHFAKESEDIYNPFSVLKTFSRLDFGNYWFETGTPTFLVKMLKAVNFDIPKLENDVRIPAQSIMDYRTDNSDPVPVLYQSGYLTVKDYDNLLDEYTLGLPNEEVRYGFFRELLMVYMPGKNINGEFSSGQFIRDLWANNVDDFMTRLKAFFADIPYDLNNRKEKHYQTVFYILFKLMGQYIRVEYRTAVGRIDAVVSTGDAVYVFGFKLSGKVAAEDALKQIDEKDYPIPFTASGKRIVKIGVEFDADVRGVGRWIVG